MTSAIVVDTTISGSMVDTVPNHPLLLVADAHVRPDTSVEAEFREMLAWVSTTDYDIAFLGDVLELWIGLKRYSTALSSEFLEWCSSEKARRRVLFVEGNHEFFVVRHHGDCFTESSKDELPLGEVVLVHGDTAQDLPSHRRFRRWSKSWLMHFFVHWAPFAPAFVRRLKRNFERKSAMREHRYPSADVEHWGAECLAHYPQAKRLVLGHFHCQQEHLLPDGRQITVLPAWKDAYQVGVLNPANSELVIQNWRDLTAGPETRSHGQVPDVPVVPDVP